MRRGLLLAFGVACTTFASLRAARAADAKAECLAAADQGQSLRDDGKYRKAREAFATCARDVCPKVVARSCSQWLRETDDAMPTVVLGAKDAAGNDVARAHVTLDGEPFTEALDGKPLPVDPGEHVLRFARPGGDPVETRVVVRAAEKNRAVTVTFAMTPVAPATPEPAPESTGSPLFTPRNVTAGALVVVGLAAVAGGAYFLSQSGSQSNTASGLRSGLASYQCTLTPGSSTCTQLESAVDAQHTDSALGVTLLAGGGALFVGGIVAWLVWPKASDAEHTGVRWIAPVVGSAGGTIALGGAF
jgi:hypothetical protein